MSWLADVMVLDLIRLVGKVSHHDVRINFREFVSLCWKGFFEEPPEEDDISDVQDAFEILGGGPGREGEVRKEKLKEFANSAQLTMDVDKFLELVDEDGSGRVDFKEFCELFADSKRDTNLHNTGAVWLRNYEADVEESISQGHDVSGGFLPGSTSRQSTSMQKSPSLSINVTDYNDTAVDETLSPQRSHSRKDLDTRSYSRKELGSDHSGMEQSVTITRHRDSFFGQESTTFPGTPSLQAPKMKKVLQSTLPKFKHSTHNSVDTKCRHGWRCSQMSRNNPRSEGYNYYNVKTNQFQELNSAGVKMRKRGAEFTIKEHSSQRINVRLSSEMRCIRQTKIHASRPRSRAATALDGSVLDTNLGATFKSQDAARPQTVPVTGLSASRKNLPMLRITTRPVSRQDGSDIRRVAEGLLGSRGLASSHGGSVGSTRNYSFKDPDRPRLWRTNMKQPAVDMQTTSDLLKLAASAGLYDGRGFQKEMGPGINFFDND